MIEITTAWDTAGASPAARAAIHPAGGIGDEAYEASGRQAARELGELLEPLVGAGATVLDFGCGDGRVSIPLAERFNVICADASPAMLARLQQRASLPVCLANGSDPSHLPGGVDAVVALAVLIHHDHVDGAQIIATLAGAVRVGGVLALTLPLYEQPRDRREWIDVTVWTLPELEQIARALSLEILQANVSPGAFSWQQIGEHHHDLVLLRRQAEEATGGQP